LLLAPFDTWCQTIPGATRSDEQRMESRFNQKMRQFAQLEFLKAKTTPADNGRNCRQPPCAHHRSYPRNFTLCEGALFF
jgi:hypothetical protein